MERELMERFVAEFTKGNLSPTTLASVAQAFQQALVEKRGRGRPPRDPDLSFGGYSRLPLNGKGEAEKRTKGEVWQFMAARMAKGDSWTLALNRSASKFDKTADGIKKILVPFGGREELERFAKAKSEHVDQQIEISPREVTKRAQLLMAALKRGSPSDAGTLRQIETKARAFLEAADATRIARGLVRE